MKIFRVVITETVVKTYEIGVNPDQSAWDIADTVYQLEGDSIEGMVVDYEISKILEEHEIVTSEFKH